MIQSVRQICKEHQKSLENAQLIVIQENFNSHADFLTVSFLLDALRSGKEVTFLALRQNYAHYLALSKKIGKSIEQFGKNGKLLYYQAFVSQLCSELPLTQSSPSVFCRPPKFVISTSISQLKQLKIKQNSLFIVDSISFIEHEPSLCYHLYENAILNRCRIIFGGCTYSGNVSKILQKESNLWIKIQNDVGGHGKFRLCQQSVQTSLLWKWGQGKFEVSKYMKI